MIYNNFDNVFISMLTFYEITLQEEWDELAYDVIDSTGPDTGPIKNNRPLYVLLLIVYIISTTFVVMNLFVSVIVDKMNEEIKKKDGSHKLNDE